MRYVIIEVGKVTNAAEAESEADLNLTNGQTAVASDTAQVGDAYDGTTFTSPPEPVQLPTWSDIQMRAKQTLDMTDSVVLRCYEAGIEFPSDWRAYRQSLRAIARSADGDPTMPFPVKPAYPAGT